MSDQEKAVGRFFSKITRGFDIDKKLRLMFPELVITKGGAGLRLRRLGSLSAILIKETWEWGAHSYRPKFIPAKFVKKLDEVNAELKKLHAKRDRLLKKAYKEGEDVPVAKGARLEGIRGGGQ